MNATKKHDLAKALGGDDDVASADRILEAAFFRTRPLQAGTNPRAVIRLDERRAREIPRR
jgi:hypothetical protein